MVEYGQALDGYEKGEAQVFCDRLFQAFGHEGYKEAGATLELQVKRRRGRGTKFADLVWRPRLLIEMKSRGEKLQKHYRQAFEYWVELVPDRPRYVVLCNFDEFWIYDFNTQLDSPMDRLSLEELPDRHAALNFLFPKPERPLFGNDKVTVTREAADKVAQVFNALVARDEPRERAQRFILQCVVAMFGEDFDLLPRNFFTQLLTDCVEGENAYDLVGGLFRQMASPRPGRGGRFKDVKYFNGGLFEVVEPVELGREECQLLLDAASEQWSRVAPPIFGTLFQGSMDQARRHALGAHFTHEVDIQKTVSPSIVAPWSERIDAASTLRDLEKLSRDILEFRVLDPACGSGNFLYVAYRELVNLEMEILNKIHEKFGARTRRAMLAQSLIRTTQFYGFDSDPFAVELAKVTLMLGKRIAVAENWEARFSDQQEVPFEFEEPLPLDNLDKNIICDDAVFCDWPKADAIIGNPPYQSKNKMQREFGRAYVNRVRREFPDVPGLADYCVYWFRRAHDELPQGGRAGLVGTNTIRQTNSRKGGLDYIVSNGGTITEAVSTQAWSGDADVSVSIVNWCKGKAEGTKKLFRQLGDSKDSPWEMVELDTISAALSGRFDVTQAKALPCNKRPKSTHQGQTHGHDGFLVSKEEARAMIAADSKNAEVIFPFLNGEELIGLAPRVIERWAIDFHPRDIFGARQFAEPFRRLEEKVLPDRQAAAAREEERNREALEDDPEASVNHHHANFLRRWWMFSYPREQLMGQLAGMNRYIACARVTKRPIFVFLPTTIHPNDLLQVFTFEDDYSFGVLQSHTHWTWFTERCSTLTERFRYTSTTVYDSFPWPQDPTIKQAVAVREAARDLRKLRSGLLSEWKMSLRALYRTLEHPGENPLKVAHEKLDRAVLSAFGFSAQKDVLEQLFELNAKISVRAPGESIPEPGLPPCVGDRDDFVSSDFLLKGEV